MTREQAIQVLAEFMTNMDISEDTTPTDGARILMDFLENEMGMKRTWKAPTHEGH